MLNGAKHVTFREVQCENPGLYGLYPVECMNVLIERCRVTGAKDAGIVPNNRVHTNNHINFGDPSAIVSRVPSGTGILILAADEVEVAHNDIRDNLSFGVAVVGLDLLFSAGTHYDVDPVPERCRIHSNTMNHNGGQASGVIKQMGLAGVDLLWDLSGYDNNWHQPGASKLPALLPHKTWPDIARRANWRLWRVLRKVSS